MHAASLNLVTAAIAATKPAGSTYQYFAENGWEAEMRSDFGRIARVMAYDSSSAQYEGGVAGILNM
jgi:hypothetical protein